MPPDVAASDALEDGHERNIDPKEFGAKIYSEHDLDFEAINEDAIKVLRRLNRHGFQAYLVGGCVRDLLVGQRPKDFDIATSATPRQVKGLFRNSRLIGRRFRLVHVHFGGHIIEVSTFRKDAAKETDPDNDDPLIRSDNVFGNAAEDAQRRDFTINGLYFDIEKREVIDFVGGMLDVKRKCIEIIGDPETRLREDPVRMLRAAKFSGRLDFDLAADLYDAITEVREDLTKSAAPRLFEELLRLLGGGGALGAFEVLYDTQLLEVYLPEVSAFLDADNKVEGLQHRGEQRFWNSLKSLDRVCRSGRHVDTAVKLGVVFCHLFDHILHHNGAPPEDGHPSQYDIGVMVEKIFDPIGLRMQIPKRDLYRLKQVIVALRRMLSRKARGRKPSPNQFVRKEYFPDAVKLLDIYSQGLGDFQGECHAWRERYEKLAGKPLI
ncbi:MAG: poly(A) polymerase [Planctomycetota bacterium]